MQKILQELEKIARAAKGGSEKEVLGAIQAARESIRGLGAEGAAALKELDQELSVWQSKLPVIWKEIVGRQGMVKHAAHWAEKLRESWQTK
jgi:hypothetical protein